MEKHLKLEFRKKSNSKRRHIFKTRARPLVKSLVIGFYKQNEIRISHDRIDSLADAIIDGFISLAKNESFISTVLSPEAETQVGLIEKIYNDVAEKTKGSSPFQFIHGEQAT